MLVSIFYYTCEYLLLNMTFSTNDCHFFSFKSCKIKNRFPSNYQLLNNINQYLHATISHAKRNSVKRGKHMIHSNYTIAYKVIYIVVRYQVLINKHLIYNIEI